MRRTYRAQRSYRAQRAYRTQRAHRVHRVQRAQLAVMEKMNYWRPQTTGAQGL